MSQSPNRAHDLALRLLRIEGASADSTSEAVGAAADRVLRRLQADLSRWFGSEGFIALLGRALDRARPGCPPLASVIMQLNGEHPGAQLPAGLLDDLKSSSPAEALDASAKVVATLISLLGRLVGDDVATRLVEQGWQDQLGLDPQFPDERT